MSHTTDKVITIMNSVSEHNRDVLAPFMEELTERFYKQLDIAAEKGVVLQSGISEATADSILNELLFQVQKDYQGIQFEKRNLLENVAFAAGATVGYPLGVVKAVVSKLPLAAHFSAGVTGGTYKSQTHISSVLCRFSKKKKQVVDSAKKTVVELTEIKPSMQGV